MMTVRTLASLTLLGALALGGCKKEWSEREHMSAGAKDRALGEPGGSTTLTGITVINNQTAIDQIVVARCARESACKDVGPDKRVGTQESCLARVKSDMKSDLNVTECPRGIDQQELTECLDAIKKEDCNNPLDALGRLAACRAGELCLK